MAFCHIMIRNDTKGINVKKQVHLLYIAIFLVAALLGVLIFQHAIVQDDLKTVAQQEISKSRSNSAILVTRKGSTFYHLPSDDQGQVYAGLEKEMKQVGKEHRDGQYRFVGAHFTDVGSAGAKQADIYIDAYKREGHSLKKLKSRVVKTVMLNNDFSQVKVAEFLSRSANPKKSLKKAIKKSAQANKMSDKDVSNALTALKSANLKKMNLAYEGGKINLTLDQETVAVPVTALYTDLNPNYLGTDDLDAYRTYKRSEAYHDKMPGKYVALTFDDGPDPTTTPQVLEILSRYNAKATFFVVGRSIYGNEQILQDTLAQGHEIGNHSWSHPQLSSLSMDALHTELNDTSQAIFDATGRWPTVFRPPYGATNETVRGATDMFEVLWDVDSLDWKSKNTPAILQDVQEQTTDGSVILMHDIHQTTVDALPTVMDYLASQGYQFVTVSELYGYA